MSTLPPGDIELGLFAPYNPSVELIGSWNDWKPIPLKRSDDGWWRHIVKLPDGEHRYKFRVVSNSYFARGETLEVFDPYAIQVSNDEQEATIIRIEGGRQREYSYEWKHDHVPLPQNDRLIIYEMHVADFTRGLGGRGPDGQWEKGQFRHVLEKLDYLVELGVNCVELMPVKEFPGTSWGYNLKSLFAIENTYGPPADLALLVDECHARGIRVIMDGVYNHADKDAPLAHIDYDYWFHNPNPDPPEMHWGPKYDYGKFDEKLGVFPARKYVIDSIRRMVEWFHIDGIRFDATRAIGRFDVLRELAEAGIGLTHGIKPFINICEHISEDAAVTGYPDGPMHAAWHESLAKHLQAAASAAPVDWADNEDLDALVRELNPATNGYNQGWRTINYASSHDQVRLMRTIGEKGSIFGDGAFRRMKLAAGLLFTAPGVPMLWMGQEFGMANDKNHAEPRPLDWSLLNNESNADLLRHTSRLVQLRRDTDALWSDNFEVVLLDRERRLLGFKRWNEHGGQVVVVVNLTDDPAGEFRIEGKGLVDGAWIEQISGATTEVHGGTLAGELGRSEVKIYIKQ